MLSPHAEAVAGGAPEPGPPRCRVPPARPMDSRKCSWSPSQCKVKWSTLLFKMNSITFFFFSYLGYQTWNDFWCLNSSNIFLNLYIHGHSKYILLLYQNIWWKYLKEKKLYFASWWRMVLGAWGLWLSCSHGQEAMRDSQVLTLHPLPPSYSVQPWVYWSVATHTQGKFPMSVKASWGMNASQRGQEVCL